ncbi:MAG TPA: bifunctional riboflavin kinase/FAD synthetase [Candidatus Acidoferrum sp.]|jgi:riboflavin kinase/FMN adenylyltransferase|nr:bifunctional riboflavin kinase/FAD synthetase [Candidatus Acidoferrum sp.]
MNIIHAAKELETKGKRVCLAIGFFDGVHLGHQQILRQTIADARQHDGIALVLTFDQHPATIVAPDRLPPLIYSLPQKLRAIESLGVENILLIRFDKKFSEQSGEQFIRGLAQSPGKIRSICVGANFVFGHKRSGNVALLKKLGAELDFSVHGLSALSLDGQRVSSTRIREAIRAGDFDDASQMLGRPYAISGTVVVGDKLGRALGFPTANLDANCLALPPNGVYAALTKVDGKLYRVALNMGIRPTVATGKQLRVEAHLLDFHGELYGKELEIEIGEKLRDEKKFGSPEELREQIARDVVAVRRS